MQREGADSLCAFPFFKSVSVTDFFEAETANRKGRVLFSMTTRTTAPLSASAIRYLLVIRSFSLDGGGVRSALIADKLGVSRPSVHKMMESLGKAGLIHKNGYGAVFFTEEGEGLAGLYESCYERLKPQLADLLPEDTDLSQAVWMVLSVMTPLGLRDLGKI